MLKRISLALVIALAAMPVWAQSPTPSVDQPPAVAVTQELDELEQAWVLIFSLQKAYAQAIAEADACRATLAPYRTQAAGDDLARYLQDLKGKIERRHPGFEWNTTTGKLARKPTDAPTQETPPHAVK